jgi:hypothetical protein
MAIAIPDHERLRREIGNAQMRFVSHQRPTSNAQPTSARLRRGTRSTSNSESEFHIRRFLLEFGVVRLRGGGSAAPRAMLKWRRSRNSVSNALGARVPPHLGNAQARLLDHERPVFNIPIQNPSSTFRCSAFDVSYTRAVAQRGGWIRRSEGDAKNGGEAATLLATRSELAFHLV